MLVQKGGTAKTTAAALAVLLGDDREKGLTPLQNGFCRSSRGYTLGVNHRGFALTPSHKMVGCCSVGLLLFQNSFRGVNTLPNISFSFSSFCLKLGLLKGEWDTNIDGGEGLFVVRRNRGWRRLTEKRAR